MGRDSLRTALIDADVLVYKAGFGAEHTVDWQDGEAPSIFANINVAKQDIRSKVAQYLEATRSDLALLAVSDPDNNFRKRLYPDYKANRGLALRKPVLYYALREWMSEDIGVVWYNQLEGDDVLGILQTSMENTVIVSIDKDMLTVPGMHYNPDKGGEGVIEVSEDEAAWNHLYQTLMGDRVDEYPGCPGIGPVKAKRALDNQGPTWDTVVSVYENAGLDEGDALVQARLARILHNEDYDRATGEITLWNPNSKTEASTKTSTPDPAETPETGGGDST